MNSFKQSLGNTRKELYGSDEKFFAQQKPFYGSWLSLGVIKHAASRLHQAERKKQAQATADVTAQSIDSQLSLRLTSTSTRGSF